MAKKSLAEKSVCNNDVGLFSSSLRLFLVIPGFSALLPSSGLENFFRDHKFASKNASELFQPSFYPTIFSLSAKNRNAVQHGGENRFSTIAEIFLAQKVAPLAISKTQFLVFAFHSPREF